MEIFLVGGAVRDALMGLAVTEKDYVVVGATVEEMLAKGFIQVGKDFPVFLHPTTREEYALARTERKTGRGYNGFSVYASPEVTLVEDLARRDLTINAIAQDAQGNLIDPFGGQEDIKRGVLRHVSEAFVEDPLRVLRIARFAARFSHFTIAPQTQNLIEEMVKSGELSHLIPARVWKEMEKALQEEQSNRFFHLLYEYHAVSVLYPTLNQNTKAWENAISRVEKLGKADVHVKFAVFLYPDLLGNVEEFQKFCSNYPVPNAYKNVVMNVIRGWESYVQLSQPLTSEKIMHLFEIVDAIRRPSQLTLFLEAVSAFSIHTQRVHQQILLALEKIATIHTEDIIASDLSGLEIAKRIRERRLAEIDKLLSEKL